MSAVLANPYASRSQHISSPKIAQLRLNLIARCLSLISYLSFQISVYRNFAANFDELVRILFFTKHERIK